MRIVCISDPHGRQESMMHPVPDGDVLICAGDISMRGKLHEIEQFNSWVGTLPHKRKVVIAGNHDWGFQLSPIQARGSMYNVTYLQDEVCVIDGVKIYGSPWQPWFHDWAFNFPYYDREAGGAHAQQCWSQIPDDTDVLITHGPPMGILDTVAYPIGEKVGCQYLRRTIFERLTRLKLHVFGHIHEGYGQQVLEGITFVNASTCNRGYLPNNPPIIVDI